MGFKDLSNSTVAKQSQSAANKSTTQQNAATSDTMSKEEALANIKATK